MKKLNVSELIVYWNNVRDYSRIRIIRLERRINNKPYEKTIYSGKYYNIPTELFKTEVEYFWKSKFGTLCIVVE